jgi:tetratricopeptide (TPR) repeat protein
VAERIDSTIKPVDHALALYNLAMTLSWAGKYEEALRLSEGAMAMRPGNSDATSLHGRLLQKLGRGEEALTQLEEAVRLNPNDSLALSRVAEEYGRTGKIELARDHLQRAIRHTPERAPISFRANLHVQLGQCHFLLGESSDARHEFETALEIDPSAAAARDWLKRLSSDRP